MTGKMFGGGHHPAFMRALDVGRDQIADLFGIFSEGACVDDGIGGIGIHIGIGKKIPVNADGARLLRR